MDKEQKIQYQQKVEKYLSNQNIYGLFQYLMKSLIAKQPEDPISFLIKTIQISCQQTIVIKSILQNSKNIHEQINYKKLVQKAQTDFFRLFHDNQIIKPEVLKGQIFDKIATYSLNQKKSRQFQFILNSYQKVYQERQFYKIKKQVEQFGENAHRFLNELHFDHERSAQIVTILFGDRFLSTFDLNKSEINIKEGFLDLSRRVFRCCDKDLNSFAFLINQMIDWASMKKITAGEIDDSLIAIIQQLQKHYPATQVSGQQIEQKKLDFEQTKDEKVTIKLKGQTGKQKWANLNQNILEMAKQAEQLEAQLKYITKKSCLDQNGTSFKTGTKVKGQQSIERVKEKLVQKIFQKKKNEKPYKQIFKEAHRNLTMQQFLNKEKEEYDRFIESWISDKQQIQFTVDDMVRGKCMFDSIVDIYKAAQKIIENCKQKNIGIVKIKNRLNKKTSDFVFKLKMKNVVAQFQLALKFNVVKNEFNHKIYELLRSPGFSVTQTVFQNKEKSQRFVWDIQSMLKSKENMPASIKSEYFQYLKKKNPEFRSESSTLQLKRQRSNSINAEKKNLQNNNFWTAIFLIKFSQYQAAIQELRKALQTTKIEIEEAQILNQIGNVYKARGNFAQAVEYYNRCLKIKEKVKGKESIDCVTTLNSIGLVFHRQGNYAQAQKCFIRCLEIQERIRGKQNTDYAATLNNIGFAYRAQGKYSQALKYYTLCLEIQQKIKGKDSLECATTLNNIGVVNNNRGNYSQALKYYIRCLEIQEKMKGKDNIDCATTLNNTGLTYHNLGNNAQALKHCIRSLDIKEKIKGKDHIDCAISLSNIGIVFKSQGNYAQAFKYYSRCLDIQEKTKGKDSIDCANTLSSIGSVLKSQGNYAQAFIYYSRCLEIKQKTKGRDSIDCAITLSNIGSVLKSQENYVQAFKYYSRCLEIQQKNKGRDSIDCAITLNNIGSVFKSQGNYAQAFKYYSRCLEIQEKTKGKDSIDCATTLSSIGSVYRAQDNYAQALKYYSRCLEIQEKNKGKESLDYAITLNNIGFVFDSQDNYAQALKYYSQCLAIKQKIKGKESIDCVTTLSNMGSVYKAQKKYVQALEYYSKCLKIQQKHKGKESLDCATTLNSMGGVYKDQGNYPQAKKFYLRASSIRDSILGPNHPKSKLVRENLEQLNKHQK